MRTVGGYCGDRRPYGPHGHSGARAGQRVSREHRAARCAATNVLLVRVLVRGFRATIGTLERLSLHPSSAGLSTRALSTAVSAADS